MANDIIVTIKISRVGEVTSKLIPGSVSESKSANFDPTQIRGRSLPVFGYASSEARTVELSILLVASNYKGGGDIYETGEDVWNAVTKLKAACYPNYASAPIKPPPVCSLTVGAFIKVPTCVITSTSITWGDAYDKNDYPLKAEVSLSFTEVQAVPSMDTDVAKRGF